MLERRLGRIARLAPVRMSGAVVQDEEIDVLDGFDLRAAGEGARRESALHVGLFVERAAECVAPSACLGYDLWVGIDLLLKAGEGFLEGHLAPFTPARTMCGRCRGRRPPRGRPLGRTSRGAS